MANFEKFKVVRDELENSRCFIGECNFGIVINVSAAELLKHFRVCHRKDIQFSSPCLFSKNCFHSQPFKSYDTLYKHLRLYHAGFFQIEEQQLVEGADHVPPDNDMFIQDEGNMHQQHQNVAEGYLEHVALLCDAQPQPDDAPVYPNMDTGLLAGKFIRDLLAVRKLTQMDIQEVMKGTETLVKAFIKQTLSDATDLMLRETGCDHSDVLYTLDPAQLDLFAGLKNQYSQIKFFKEKFNLIMPVKVELPARPEDFGRVRTGQDQQFRRQNYTYVPLIQQIQALLNLPDVYREVMRPKKNVPGTLSCYEDGLNYRSSPFFKRYPKALQLHFSADEVEMCNPIGSYTHKLVYAYFSLGNLPYRLRSNFTSINLASIFYHEQVSLFDYNTLLAPFVNDVKLLEEGVEIEICGRKQLVHGTLTAAPADNLAAHQFAGFKAGFAKGFRKCRTCVATDEEMQTKFSDWEFLHRTKESHDEQCALLNVQDLQKHFSKLYGINHNSVLNELKYFHVVGGMVPDIMHDLLEGVVPLTICEALLYFIGKKWFSLDEFNYAIQNFKYSPNEVNDKPSIIKLEHLKRKSLRQSATQRWLLFLILPLIVGERIPKGNLQWNVLILLMKICRLTFKDSFTSFEIVKLGDLISKFLTSFKSVYKRRIIPKMHHMVHYPHYIKSFGPLLPLWCMRYEGKHSYFKQVLRIMGNFKNVPWSLSYRHQQWMSQKMSSCDGQFLKVAIKFSKAKILSLKGCPYGGQIAQYLDMPTLGLVHFYENVTINSVCFTSKNSVVLCPLQGSRSAQFGLIDRIIYFNGRMLFACKMLRTKSFSRHFQSYVVCFTFSYLVFDRNDLIGFHPFALHTTSFKRPNCFEHYVYTRTELDNLL